MPANTAIIPIKAVRLGDQATGDVRGIGELESGDKISPSYLNLTDVSLSGNTAFDTSTLFVDGTNNRVGINSSSPQKNLQINDSTSPTIRFSRDTSYYWEIGHTASDFQLNSQTGGTIMHLNYDGNVGIGTSSPAEQLEVYGTEASGGVELLLTNYGDGGGTTTPYTAIRARLNPVRNGGEIRFGRDGTYSSAAAADSNIQFYTAVDDVNTERMRINSSGNVGIGTTTPAYKLVVSSSGASGIEFGPAYSGTSNLIQHYNRSGGAYVDVLNIAAQHRFYIGGSEKMRIDSSGNVGIGTGGPNNPLHIVTTNKLGGTFTGTTAGEGVKVSQSSYTADNYVSLIEADYQNGGVPNVRIAAQFHGAGSELVFGTTNNYASGVNNSALIINQTGQIGIGVDPSYTLDVDTGGTAVTARFARGGLVASPARTLIRFEDSDTSTLLGYIACTTSTTTYATSSDYRLKENVTGITDGIDRVKQLSPSRFNFIVSPDTTVDGFLAHEVSSIVPEAITGTKDAVDDEGNPEYQGIDQSKLVPLLTAALQESIAKIEALEARVATLENN